MPDDIWRNLVTLRHAIMINTVVRICESGGSKICRQRLGSIADMSPVKFQTSWTFLKITANELVYYTHTHTDMSLSLYIYIYMGSGFNIKDFIWDWKLLVKDFINHSLENKGVRKCGHHSYFKIDNYSRLISTYQLCLMDSNKIKIWISCMKTGFCRQSLEKCSVSIGDETCRG